MKFQNLVLIGTSHIAKESVADIKASFSETNPDIIAIELDKRRLHVLLHPEKYQDKIKFRDIFKIGFKGFLFSMVGHWVEKKLGESVGTKPGVDMLTAVELARDSGKQIALIDQDIEITLKRLSKAFSWREKWQVVVDLFNGFVLKKKEIEGFDLNKVPSKKMVSKMISVVKKKYPRLFHVLVTERNEVMAKRLMIIMKRNPDKKIMAVVGAGHEEDIIGIIKKRINSIEVF
jgi:pheromone shutdown-related protein TraB